MKIGIVGAGGVGGYFGGRLAAAGSDVVWLARGAQLAALQRDGLRVQSQLGDLHLPTVQVSDAAAAIGPVDLLLLTVKLWDTAAALESARPMIGQHTTVMSLQNGVQKDALLRAALGDAVALLGGVVYIEAHIEAPGLIVHGGTLQRLVFGPFDGAPSPLAEEFLQACQTAGIVAELSPTIEKAIWEKFVFLVGLSTITSASRLTIGPMRTNAHTRGLLLGLMREVVLVGRARGIDLPEAFADEAIGRFDAMPSAMTSSMHKDLLRGSRLELAWLSGHVVELGRALGVATPINQVLSDVLDPYANGQP